MPTTATPYFKKLATELIQTDTKEHAERSMRFDGRVQTEWQDDGRETQLLAPFAFIDDRSVVWDAPAGAYIDGASIPRVLWGRIGSPYTGKYRLASVVHDIACCRKERPWRQVHRMFFDASVAAGVPTIKAKVMYAAIFHFGPRWPAAEDAGRVTTEQDFDELCEFVEHNDPSLDAIDRYKPTTPRGEGLRCFRPE